MVRRRISETANDAYRDDTNVEREREGGGRREGGREYSISLAWEMITIQNTNTVSTECAQLSQNRKVEISLSGTIVNRGAICTPYEKMTSQDAWTKCFASERRNFEGG